MRHPLSLYFLPLISLISLTASASEWFTPHITANFDINSSCISRGKVCENTPIEENEFDISFGLSDYGYVGVYNWNYFSLDDKYREYYRAALPEIDWMPYYGYEWQFADGWSVDTQVRCQWMTYYGCTPRDYPTSFELFLYQAVKSPYVTLFYHYRHTFKPVDWSLYLVGVKHTFTVCPWLKLTPRVTTDFADSTGRTRRIAPNPDGSSLGAGILSFYAEILAEVPITDYMSVYAAVGQFAVLSRDGRDNLERNYQREITTGRVGVSFSF